MGALDRAKNEGDGSNDSTDGIDAFIYEVCARYRCLPADAIELTLSQLTGLYEASECQRASELLSHLQMTHAAIAAVMSKEGGKQFKKLTEALEEATLTKGQREQRKAERMTNKLRAFANKINGAR